MSGPQIDPPVDPGPEPQIVPGTSRPIPVDPNLDPQTHPAPAES
ncbi:hypothetical protein [Nocardioides marmorisolisilvae]|nr:hypothetical protein [Nocardioides marmorisolisilvae]